MKLKELMTYLARYDKDLEVVFSNAEARGGACTRGHLLVEFPPIVISDCGCGIVLELGKA